MTFLVGLEENEDDSGFFHCEAMTKEQATAKTGTTADPLRG
jgi:hypothetical protein